MRCLKFPTTTKHQDWTHLTSKMKLKEVMMYETTQPWGPLVSRRPSEQSQIKLLLLVYPSIISFALFSLHRLSLTHCGTNKGSSIWRFVRNIGGAFPVCSRTSSCPCPWVFYVSVPLKLKKAVAGKVALSPVATKKLMGNNRIWNETNNMCPWEETHSEWLFMAERPLNHSQSWE